MEITRSLKLSPEVNFSFPWHFQPMDDENDDIRITFQTSFITVSPTKQAKWNSIFNAAHFVWALCNLVEKINWTLQKASKFPEGRGSTILQNMAYEVPFWEIHLEMWVTPVKATLHPWYSSVRPIDLSAIDSTGLINSLIDEVIDNVLDMISIFADTLTEIFSPQHQCFLHFC